MVDADPQVMPEVLQAVATRFGALGSSRQLAGGVRGGAWRLELSGGGAVVLKAHRPLLERHLEQLGWADAVVHHMRERGYPTPRWLAIGATNTHVWYVQELVRGEPAQKLTASVVERLVEVIELQQGQAAEPSVGHSPFTARVAKGLEPDFDHLAAYSSDVGDVVARVHRAAAGADGAALTLGSQILHMLAFPMSRGRDDIVQGVARKATTLLDECGF